MFHPSKIWFRSKQVVWLFWMNRSINPSLHPSRIDLNTSWPPPSCRLVPYLFFFPSKLLRSSHPATHYVLATHESILYNKLGWPTVEPTIFQPSPAMQYTIEVEFSNCPRRFTQAFYCQPSGILLFLNFILILALFLLICHLIAIKEQTIW